ncbi:MAG: hypothetical protein E6J14_11670 [Chloroflexi bacterium]|nr:MAG: hypothetical protein E6J14_11670 [Chloroflexota bacterium]
MWWRPSFSRDAAAGSAPARPPPRRQLSQTLSFDAYLRFIEDDFLGGQRLNPHTDGRPDSRPHVVGIAAGMGDLINDFDFTQPVAAADAGLASSAGIPDTGAARANAQVGAVAVLVALGATGVGRARRRRGQRAAA